MGTRIKRDCQDLMRFRDFFIEISYKSVSIIMDAFDE